MGHTRPVLSCNKRWEGASQDTQTSPEQPRHTSHHHVTSAIHWPAPKCPCFYSSPHPFTAEMKWAPLILDGEQEERGGSVGGGEGIRWPVTPVLPQWENVGHTLLWLIKNSGWRDLLHCQEPGMKNVLLPMKIKKKMCEFSQATKRVQVHTL